MLKRYRLTNYALSFLCLLSASVNAFAEEEVDWEFNGFITQGYVWTDENNFYGNSENGSADFRELGINSAVRLSDNLIVTGQLMSRKAGAVDDGTPSVDYALLDYRLAEKQWGHVGVRLGRIKNPFGFYNTTRDVAFTRPSMILPQSLYFDKARNLELSSDGGMLYGLALFDAGRIKSELVIGEPRKDINVEYAYLNKDWPGSFEGSEGYLWRTEYSTNDYSFIAAFTYGNFKLDFEVPGTPGLGAPGNGGVDIDVSALSLQYNLDRWSITGEYFRQDISWGSLGGVYGLNPENESEAFYLQLEHRFSPEVSMFLRRDILYIDMDDRDGLKTQALFGRPAHTQYGRDWTLGVGWEPNRDWLFRAEWHKVKGTAWLAVQDNPDDSKHIENWNMLSLQATYRF
jgi:hypothetical protein